MTYNPQLRSTLDEMVAHMTGAIRCFGLKDFIDIEFAINVLPLYLQVLDKSSCLANTKSQGLKSLNGYFQNVNSNSLISRVKKQITKDKVMSGDAISLLAVAQECRSQIYDLFWLRGPLNFYCGFSKLNQDLIAHGFDICRPTLHPKEARIMRVKDARHPYLAKQMDEKRIDRAVPNDITHDPDSNTVVITGVANAGKTTYLRTIGILQTMGQDGFLVPAS